MLPLSAAVSKGGGGGGLNVAVSLAESLVTPALGNIRSRAAAAVGILGIALEDPNTMQTTYRQILVLVCLSVWTYGHTRVHVYDAARIFILRYVTC